MNRRIIFCFYLSVFLILFSNCKRDSIQRPNVVFILADDLGFGDLHVTGHPYIKSPNIDQLASQGLQITNAYMASGWCAPSRYALMSGQYPARAFYNTGNLDPEQPTVFSMLESAGYKIGHFGKWHMNLGEDFASSPTDFGIDEYFVPKGWPKKESWTSEQKQDEYLRAKSTDRFVDRATQFISETQIEDQEQPFYVNLWVYPSHSYIHPTPEQLSEYSNLNVNINDFPHHQQAFLRTIEDSVDINKAMQAYCADVTAMDKAIGRFLDFLSSSGLDSNTIVIFASDNGPGPIVRDLKSNEIFKRYKEFPDLMNSVGSSGVYRERKQSVSEGGIRIPFFVKWPGHINGGIVDTITKFHGIDFLPTISSILGSRKRFTNLDGTDLGDAFLGSTSFLNRPLFWYEDGVAAVLDGDLKGYKLATGEFKYYNLQDDPEENSPIEESNIALEDKLNDWLESLDKDYDN